MATQIRGNIDIVAASITDAEVNATIIRADGNNAFTANQDMGGFKLTGLAAPTADTDAARMQDVREPNRKKAVRVTTAAALPAVTAAGSGVGKTLTADAVGVLTVDGIATVLGDRILVKDQVAGADNGIYDVTTEGTAGVAFILTRATDADTSAKMVSGTSTFTSEGTAYDNKGFSLITDAPITLDTTALVFSQTSGAGQITAGAGLTKTADTINVETGNGVLVINANDITFTADPTGTTNVAPSINVAAGGAGVKVDEATINANGSGQLEVVDAGITAAKIATSVAGNGIGGGGGTALFVDMVKDEFTCTSDDQTLILANTVTSGNEDVYLRGLHQPTSAYTIGAALVFTAGLQFNGDPVEVRYYK